MSPSQISLLVVEDNPGDRRLIETRLAQSRSVSFQLRCEASLSAGLARLKAERYDCVVLDLTLPDSKGLAGLGPVTAAAAGAPVIVLTGLEDEDLGLQALKAGAQDFLSKDMALGSQSLSRAIRHAIERGRAEADLRAARQKYELLFELNPTPMWVTDVETMRFVAVNAAACESYGYSEEEFLRLSVQDLRTPETLAEVADVMARLGQGHARFFAQHRRKDGMSVEADISAAPMEFDGRRAAPSSSWRPARRAIGGSSTACPPRCS